MIRNQNRYDNSLNH